MKKILIAVIVAVVAISSILCLTACGGNGGNGDDVSKIQTIACGLTGEEYAFAVKKGDNVLMNAVNDFFAENTAEIEAIIDKYNADGVDLDSFGKVIQTEPTGSDDELVVATNLDFAPFEYTVGNKIAGIDMEIAQLLADYLDKTLVVVHMDFDAVCLSLATLPDYDIGIAGLSITESRADIIDFSNPYFTTYQVILTKAGNTTFADCTSVEDVEAKLATLTGDAAKCGGQGGTTSQLYIEGEADMLLNGYDNLTFSPYDSAQMAVQDMLNGNINFVVVDQTTAKALVDAFNG